LLLVAPCSPEQPAALSDRRGDPSVHPKFRVQHQGAFVHRNIYQAESVALGLVHTHQQAAGLAAQSGDQCVAISRPRR
jgi:hypothetical protein